MPVLGPNKAPHPPGGLNKKMYLSMHCLNDLFRYTFFMSTLIYLSKDAKQLFQAQNIVIDLMYKLGSMYDTPLPMSLSIALNCSAASQFLSTSVG